MPRYQKNRSPESSVLQTLLIHPVLWFALTTLLLMFLVSLLWTKYEENIAHQMDFELTPEKIVLVHPEPNWVRQSISDQLQERATLPRTLLAPDLVKQMAKAIETVGWIENVNEIRKSSNGVQIDLKYRMPAALVYFPKSRSTLPVDTDGRVMDDASMKLDVIDDLPRIHVHQPAKESLIAWAAWPDERIQSAVKLANFMGRSWKSLGFYQIVSYQEPGKDSVHQPLQLYPRHGAVVIWGSAPGDERPDEANAEQKFKAIAEFVLENGSFDKTNPGGLYDVRSGVLKPTKKIRTALDSNNSFLSVQ